MAPKTQTATGSFDYDIMTSIQGIQSDVRQLVNIFKKDREKAYEKSRDALKKPDLKDKPDKGKFKFPKIPTKSAVTDFFMKAGQIILAGAFLAGLLKDKIIEWFKGMEIGSLGWSLGGLMNDLLTKGPTEDDFKTRFFQALEAGAKGFMVGALVGLATMGPLGMVGGAIIGAVGAMIISWINTDDGDFADYYKKKFKAAGDWAQIGAIVGVVMGALIGPIGMVAGAIIGLAAGAIFGYLQEPRTKDDKDYIKEILDKKIGEADVSFIDRMVNTMENVRVAIHNFFTRMLNPIRKLLWGTEKAEIALDTGIIDEGELSLREDERNYNDTRGTFSKWKAEILEPNNKKIVLDKNFAFLPEDTRNRFYGDLGYNQASGLNKAVKGTLGFANFMPEFGKEYNVNDYIYNQWLLAKEIAMRSKKLYMDKLEHFREKGGRNPEEMFSNKSHVRSKASVNVRKDLLGSTFPTSLTEAKEAKLVAEQRAAEAAKEKIDLEERKKRLEDYLDSEQFLREYKTEYYRTQARNNINLKITDAEERLKQLDVGVDANLVDANKKIVALEKKLNLEKVNDAATNQNLKNDNNGSNLVISADQDNSVTTNGSSGPEIQVVPYNPILEIDRSGFSLQNMIR